MESSSIGAKRVRSGNRQLGWLAWWGCFLLVACAGRAPQVGSKNAAQTFAVRGIVRELKPDGRTVIIQHEAIPNYMAAMTMPFRARETREVAGLRSGDSISFRLVVTDDESWIDQIQIVRTGMATLTNANATTAAASTNAPTEFFLNAIPDFALTNEFAQPIHLRDYQGRAVAVTFFFTRCPIPEFCPRLTKNFRGAIEKLKAVPGGPTNFHFLSVSIDPADTPPRLRGYGRQYQYDSNHWSFVTGNGEHIRDLARGFGVPITPEGATFNHGFSTAIFDAAGRLQTIWPIGGDMTDQIVAEITKASHPNPR